MIPSRSLKRQALNMKPVFLHLYGQDQMRWRVKNQIRGQVEEWVEWPAFNQVHNQVLRPVSSHVNEQEATWNL